MKTVINLSTLCLLLGLFFIGCTNNKAAETAEQQELKEEIETLDSLNTDLEEVSQEIEQNAKELQEALENLDGSEE